MHAAVPWSPGSCRFPRAKSQHPEYLYVPIGRAIGNRDVGPCGGIPCSDHYLVHSQVILPTP
jgi:hypothetical protein